MIEKIFKDIVDQGNEYVWETPEAFPWLVGLLLAAGIFITFRMGWINVRHLRHAFDVIRGRYDNPKDEGDINHFQALTTALSATVGIGNIAGVATAIHYGGPGALFWMWVTAVFGMALKYVECTLAIQHREILPDGSAAGGPMYSIERGLGPRWKPLAIAFAGFAVISSFGSGNAVQSFTVADQFRQDLGLPTWLVGAVMALLVAAVILGGIKRIGAVTSKLVPFMAAVYVGAALLVLSLNVGQIPGLLAEIVRSAFQPAAQIGGFAGGGFIFMLTWGVKRGLFSNESGQGSAPIAHAAAKTDEPVREGVVAMLGPFIDTLIICTMTGLVILSTGVWHDKQEQRLVLNDQADVTAIVAGAEVQPNGEIGDADLAYGRLEVREGQPVGFALVRNHATVEEPMLFFADEGVLTRGGERFSGFLEIAGEEAGDIATASFTNRLGEPMDATLVLEGRAMQNGSPLTAWAFQRGLGGLAGGKGHLLVTVAVFLFGLSTAISWSYYGDRAVYYLFGARWLIPYRLVFCLMHFLGAVYSLELVWSFGDAALGLMTIPNLLSILLLTGAVKRATKRYADQGKLHPPGLDTP
jgi:AGCS family alanine or glycine:cation symporter